jgi:HAD superfamily hydrolase (TIGR01509 family)
MLVFQKHPLESIKAIMFDMDGTLIDSIDVYHAIVLDILGYLGLEMSLSRKELFECLSHGKNLSDIVVPPDLDNRGEIVQQFRNLAVHEFRETFSKGEVDLIDGVNHLLGELKRRGFFLAVVTSSATEVVLPFLKTRDLHSYLHCVLGRKDVSRLKPFPDPLLKCMEILNVDPGESLYIGDSVIDIQAGKAAGTWTCGVLTGTSSVDRLKAESPDVILESVGDLLTIL